MLARILTALTVSGALALTVTGAHAATPVLDGKKVKVMTLKAAGGAQDHDVDQVTELAKDPLGSGADRTQCVMPRCAALTFVYKPAKGVRAPIGFAMSWTVPVDDMDLYVAEVVKGERTEVAHCAAGVGTSEKVVLPFGTLVAGHTYALVADFYRSVNDNVTASVSFPSTVAVKTSVPATVDNLESINCTQ